jgi:hypothetical protein
MARWLFLDEEYRVVLWAVLFFVAAHAADIFTTQWAMLFPGIFEANPLMRDEIGKFALGKALIVKGFYALAVLLPLSWFLKKATGSRAIATFPLWWSGLTLFQAAFHNLVVIYSAI